MNGGSPLFATSVVASRRSGLLADSTRDIAGLFDMNENAAEWREECAGAGDCDVAGGSYATPMAKRVR